MTVTSAFPAEAPTAEGDWVRLVTKAPELVLSTRPAVVVAPHPDDETLAVGGLLAELRLRNVDVHVIAVTDGEASHPGDRGLAALRRQEQEAALRELGIDRPPERLGLPDSHVADHVDRLRSAIETCCRPETVVLAPWEHDGHTDHDACGVAARRATERTGATLLAYPVWAWQWAGLDVLSPLPLYRATLSAGTRAAKARAVACYPSQTTAHDGPPIVGEESLVRFARPWEVVIDVRRASR